MSSSFEVVQSEVAQQFVIDANPNFDFSYRQEDTYPLGNLAEQIQYRSVAADGVNSNNLSFKVDVSSNFMERDIYVNIEGIHLAIERNVAVPDDNGADPAVPIVVNSDTFVETFFNNYNNFAFKQHSIINCIELISIKLDNIDLEIRDPGKILKLTSPYADKTIVYEKIDHSMPDLMSYNRYKSATTPIKTTGLNGSPVSIIPSVINSSSPFGSLGDQNYNTRQPVFSFDKLDTDRKTIRVTTDELCLMLPFSLFSIPGEEAPPFVGVKKMLVNITFKSEWWKYLFCSTTGKDDSIVKVELNRELDVNLKATINTRMFTEPSYVQDGYGLSNTFVPAYNLAYQNVEYQSATSIVKANGSKTVNSLTFNMNAIPKTVYIGAKLYANTSEKLLNTADVFGRIRSLIVEMDGKQTTLFNSAGNMYQLCKRNGLSFPKESNYLTGFPIKLDVTNDLAGNQKSLIGSAARNLNAFRIISIDFDNVDNVGVEQEYEIQIAFIYDALISYNNGNFQKFHTLISLAQALSIDLHVAVLYNNQLSKVNIAGGNLVGLLAKYGPLVKRIGTGIWKLAKDKDFRNKIGDAFSDKKKENTANWNKAAEAVVEGAPGGYFSNRTPALGGYRSNITGGAVSGRFSY